MMAKMVSKFSIEGISIFISNWIWSSLEKSFHATFIDHFVRTILIHFQLEIDSIFAS